jgi:hypothetical protein
MLFNVTALDENAPEKLVGVPGVVLESFVEDVNAN